ncbi:MAG TPA: PEP/pyruvate-binding domain-containing protein [Planctomycetota bacterium]|nr:PEP/pyruvate-binding domain-containing protein [Planctomycetota bacterium]
MESSHIPSGIAGFDTTVQGLRLGDNVVWQVDSLDDYVGFARPFAAQALADGREVVYLRFAAHPPVLASSQATRTIEVDPGHGFDFFSAHVHQVIEEQGREVFYVFDSLSSLVEEWASDEQLANFFQVICPFLFELDTVAYFALLRGRHKHTVIAKIRDTTQLLLDVYRARGGMYVHPLRVWGRYSPSMFLPHQVTEDAWTPVSQSGQAATVTSLGRRASARAATSPTAPWESVYRRLVAVRDGVGELHETSPEVVALKQELTRMLIGHHPEFHRLADRYLGLGDLLGIRDRVIGSGRIGGKAAGMLLARNILLKESKDTDFSEVLEDHDSFYIGSDVFFTFLVDNDLFRLRLELSREGSRSREEFADVERQFLAGEFPAEITEQFRDMLDYFGQAPIIVRSSSLLEDNFGNAFAGKYRSEFCPNQGGPEERLEAFLRAVKLVYASALNPDALSYRRKHGLAASDEQMAILVQRVAGMPYRDFFFPTLAGVAFSRNLYAWNDRIDPAQGLIRLVLGLGTRAVNRVGGDYPRMVAVSHPQLRPEVGTRVAKYSQRLADVIDLLGNAFVTEPIVDLLAAGDYPNLQYLVSLLDEGYVRDPIGSVVEGPPKDYVLTFNRLLSHTDFVKLMGKMLGYLERAYGQPVDTEFTASVESGGRVRINLLQCRPLRVPGLTMPVEVPEELPTEETLFRSSRVIGGGVLRDLRYLLYIDPWRYHTADIETKRSLPRLVGSINRHPLIAQNQILMIGPGRWGTNNVQLGVSVGYADISNAAVLVELAHEEAGQLPEVSYGTHFFQDIVEDQIVYLAVYPDDEGVAFNREFLQNAPSILGELVPESERFRDLVRVVDVARASKGCLAHLLADAQNQRALCFLE